MWNPLKTEILDRFSAIQSFFNSTRGIGKHADQTARGLAFVQIYAAYEYSVRAIMRSAIDSIMANRHKAQDLTPELMALFLDGELKSVRECDNSKVWENRVKLFEKLFEKSPASVRNTVFPNEGNSFRHTQLQTMFDFLGIKRTPAQRRRHLHRIDEVVNNRHDVAHGRMDASDVGARYTRSEVNHILRQVQSVCLVLISAAEKRCANPANHCRKK